MSRVRIIDALFIARRLTSAYVILLPIDTGWLMGVPEGDSFGAMRYAYCTLHFFPAGNCDIAALVYARSFVSLIKV